MSPYPVGLCCPGRAAPGARSRRWSPSATRRTGNQWHSPGLGPGLCTRTPRSARRPLCTPYHFSRAEACPRVRERDNKTVDGRVKEHESILRIAGARRATAAARRRTTGASSAAARASSVVTLDARRPRSGTPRRHPLRAAPSGPRPASGSCARSASRPVDSSGPPCTDSGAATARRGPATTAGRAAFSPPVAAVVEGFVEVVPAVRQSPSKHPET